MPRRIRIQRDDVLIVGAYEFDANVLAQMLRPRVRALWAFIANKESGNIQPVMYTEDRVIWLQDEDKVTHA